MLYGALLLLSVAVVVLGIAYAQSLRHLNAQVAYIAARAEVVEELRRHQVALQSALDDDHLALLAWDNRQRLVIVEGGLYQRADMDPPEIGADARALFAEWGPDVAAAFERAVAGYADEMPYEVTTPPDMVDEGMPALTYRVRLRSNSSRGAGYAIAHDVTDHAVAMRQLQRDAERSVRRAEAEFARAAEYERLIQTKYIEASPTATRVES